MANDHTTTDLESREPTLGDLCALCRELNARGARYVVIGGFAIRVADEIVVDLMKSAGGIDYRAALPEVVTVEVEGVLIPFASPRLLWRMKVVTGREKDAGDILFLREWFAARRETPPSI